MTKKYKTALSLSWLFTIACMVIIFYYSNQTATVSTVTSDSWIMRLFNLFGIKLTPFIIRKLAHSLEYCGLCMAFNTSYGLTFKKLCPVLSVSSTVFYAATDEIHQYFIDGRACQLRDVFVDFCGALAGVLFCIVVYSIILKLKHKSEEKICQF